MEPPWVSCLGKAFEDFVAKFHKTYANDEERQHRQEIFAENLTLDPGFSPKRGDYGGFQLVMGLPQARWMVFVKGKSR